MPKTTYSAYFKGEQNHLTPLDVKKLTDDLNNDASAMDFGQLKYLLMAWRDKQLGIDTAVLTGDEIADENCKTGLMLERDACDPKPIKDRINQNAPLFHMIDLMQRSLITMRAIDHTLSQRAERYSDQVDVYATLQKQLKTAYTALLTELTELQSKPEFISGDSATQKKLINETLNPLEKEFNTTLCQVLHQAHLDRGLTHPSEYKELLNHYRNLSSVLDIAPSIRSKAKLECKGITTKTAHPITKKTAAQHRELAHLAMVEADPYYYGMTAHSKLPVAFQEANNAFFANIDKDDRRLSAQTRKTHDATVKNGYIVTLDCGGQKLTFVRTATIAYVGEHASYARRVRAAEENIKQILQAAGQHSELSGRTEFNFEILNTNMWHESQHIMVGVTRKVTHEVDVNSDGTNMKGHFTNVPVNILGIFFPTHISQSVAESMGKTYSWLTTWLPFRTRWSRNQTAIDAGYAASKTQINIIACASGRDRTGRVDTGICQEHLFELTQNQSTAECFEAITQSNAFTAHVANSSGYGQKACSNPGQAYGDQSFMATADRNKQVLIDTTAVRAATQTDVLGKDYLVDVIGQINTAKRHQHSAVKEFFFDQKIGKYQKDALHELAELLENLRAGKKLDPRITSQLGAGDIVSIKRVITAWESLGAYTKEKNGNLSEIQDAEEKHLTNAELLSQHRNRLFTSYGKTCHREMLDNVNDSDLVNQTVALVR